MNIAGRIRTSTGSVRPQIGNTGGGSGDNLSTLTFSHVIPSHRDRLLLVAVGDAGEYGVTGVTYNAVAMTQLVQTITTLGTASDRAITWYFMRNPPVGTANVVVSFSDGTSNTPIACSLDLYNVDQASTFGATVVNSTNGATSVAVSVVDSTALDLDVTGVCTRNNTPTVASSQAQAGSTRSDSTFAYIAIATKNGTGSTNSLSYTFTSTNAAIAGFAVRGRS